MNVTVDGIIYQKQTHGGISRLYDEILPRMCDRDEDLRIHILTSGTLRKSPPVHPQIACHSLFPIDDFLRPAALWRTARFQVRARLQHRAGRHFPQGLWHSTDFTLPHDPKMPVVLTVYDLAQERFADGLFNKPIFAALRSHKRKCIDRADAIISISGATRDDLAQYLHVDPARVKIIHLAASPGFRPLKNGAAATVTDARRPFLLYIGGRFAYKNFARLLQAYRIWERSKDIGLVVAGEPWKPHERDLLRRLQLDGRVSLLSGLSDEGLCELYNQAAAFVFPSLHEGFGIPLLEAMACGCPIVASRISTTLEVAADVPIYFEPQAPESLVVALERALGEGRRSARTARGLKLAAGFSWDRTAQQTLDVYRTLAISG